MIFIAQFYRCVVTMTVIDKEGEIYDMDKKETFGGEIAKQLPDKDIYIMIWHILR